MSRPRDLVRRLPLGRVSSFVDPRTGEGRFLRDPFAPATPRQLRRLNELGALVVVEPGTAESLSVGEAAWAIDWLAKGHT